MSIWIASDSGATVLCADRCSCGARASKLVMLPTALAAWGYPKPPIQIGQCNGCQHRWMQWLMGWAAVALAMGVTGASSVRLVLLLWPWMPWFAGIVISVVGAALAWFVGSLCMHRVFDKHYVAGRGIGVGATIIKVGKRGWWLHVVRREVAEALTSTNRFESTEILQPIASMGLVVVLTVLAVSLGLWSMWHQPVRMINVSDKTIEIRIDGRQVAILASLPIESPSAGEQVMVMQGRRVFEAYGLDGKRLDRSEAVVSNRSQLYAPLLRDECVWIEHKGYGKAETNKTRITRITSSNDFYSLPFVVDGWFQPNPPASRNRWFSGGIRRTVRRGACNQMQEK